MKRPTGYRGTCLVNYGTAAVVMRDYGDKPNLLAEVDLALVIDR